MARDCAQSPQDLESLLIARQHQGDIDGMVALYESDAVLDYGAKSPATGTEEIRQVFIDLAASGHIFDSGRQRPATVSGDLALTSTVLPDGDITVEVARRQSDGTWLWAIDKFSIL